MLFVFAGSKIPVLHFQKCVRKWRAKEASRKTHHLTLSEPHTTTQCPVPIWTDRTIVSPPGCWPGRRYNSLLHCPFARTQPLMGSPKHYAAALLLVLATVARHSAGSNLPQWCTLPANSASATGFCSVANIGSTCMVGIAASARRVLVSVNFRRPAAFCRDAVCLSSAQTGTATKRRSRCRAWGVVATIFLRPLPQNLP